MPKLIIPAAIIMMSDAISSEISASDSASTSLCDGKKLFARRIARGREAIVDMLGRITRQVTDDKGGILMFGDQVLCQGVRDLSRIGSPCAWTGSDQKNLAHWYAFLSVQCDGDDA
jgi:hypothetical protein